MFMQYFYFHYLLQYYHYSLPPYPEDTILILYQFLSVALYHFTSVANKIQNCLFQYLIIQFLYYTELLIYSLYGKSVQLN
ncbi:MAG: hypothetical protein LN546_06120, partial [Rickettsia endosymbiont of Ecitomorpha arachnoides]|nr:hypothetical protein [Rickettsia endosymbiont of Ecitomorpha arachnoides]